MTKQIIRGVKGNVKVLVIVSSKFRKKYIGSASLSKYDYDINLCIKNAIYDCIMQHYREGGDTSPSIKLLDWFINYLGSTTKKKFKIREDGTYSIKKEKSKVSLISTKRKSVKIKSKRIKENNKYFTIKFFIDKITGKKVELSKNKYKKGDIKRINSIKKGKYYNIVRDVNTNDILKVSKWSSKEKSINYDL